MDLTIGKLINIVLLLVVMSLLIFGLTTGGLNPLIENVEGRFNEVLIMFNLKDDVSFEKCYSGEVVELGGGEVFLREVGLEGEDIVLNVCRDRMCNFTGSLSGYRHFEGSFQMLEDGGWITRGLSVFSGTVEDMEFSWQLYESVSDVLESASGIDIFVDPEPTKEFILTGTGGFYITAVWQNNVWEIREKISEATDPDFGTVVSVEDVVADRDVMLVTYEDEWTVDQEGKEKYIFVRDDDRAIDIFVDRVRGVDDYEVSYDDNMGDSGEIGKLVGNKWWMLSSYDELDSDEEVEKLRLKFAEKKAKYLNFTTPSKKAVENLTKVVNGKITVDEKEFDAKLRGTGEDLVITLVLDSFRFGMKYELGRKGKSSSSYCEYSSLPFVLVEWIDGRWVERDNEQFYKLNRECFEAIYKRSLISSFLGSKCR